MTLKEIRESGLLEAYALDSCSKQERLLVEEALVKFPELKNDLYSIDKALAVYGSAHKIQPSPNIKGQIIEQINKQRTSKPPSNNVSNKFLTIALGLGLVLFGLLSLMLNNQKNNIEQELIDYQNTCDSISSIQNLQFALLEELGAPGIEVLAMQPTEKYADSKLYLHYNEQEQRVILQTISLPQINDAQSYQLWSLKANIDPIPLTVFTETGSYIALDYESGTSTYAITIEPAGGRLAPTLENLIGTFSVGS